jgi:putative transposase
MQKFKNKYRSESHRKPGWDYSKEALYYLTIVTQHRVCNLGTINEGKKMVYSDFGKIVHNEWMKSFEIRKELVLHEYVIMPNHIHAIVEIVKPKTETQPINTPITNGDTPIVDTPIVDTRFVNTHGRAYQQTGNQQTGNPNHTIPRDIKRNMPKRMPKSISSFMAGFKSAVNTKIDDYIDANNLDIPKYNRSNHFFQPNYHDHIIRDDIEFNRIKYYIRNNPNEWVDDSLNS